MAQEPFGVENREFWREEHYDKIPKHGPPVPAQPETPTPPTPDTLEEEAAQASDDLTPGDVAYDESITASEQEDGIVTQIGNALGYVTGPDLTSDALNALAAGANQLSGGRLQGLDDFIQGAEEQRESQARLNEQLDARRAAGEMSPVEEVLDTTSNVLEGAAGGLEAGIAMPFTIAARLLNQNAPWADPPETLKNSPLGETVFKTVEIIAPTLLTGGVAGGAGLATSGTAALAAESAMETATQRTAEDLIAGRTIAKGFGEIADYLGFDGAQLTREMIEGGTFEGEAAVAVAGFFQNLGINIGFDQLVKQVAKHLPQRGAIVPTGSSDLAADITEEERLLLKPGIPPWLRPGTANELPSGQKMFQGGGKFDRAAEILRKDVEEVEVKILDDVTQRPQDRFHEPHEQMEVDTDVQVSKPSEGNSVISDEAFVQQAIKLDPDSPGIRQAAGLAADGLTDTQRSYFTNYSGITDKKYVVKAIEELTKNIDRLKKFPDDYNKMAAHVATWWKDNYPLMGPNFGDVIRNAYRDFALPMDPKVSRQGLDDLGIPWERQIREQLGLTVEGMGAYSMLLEEGGIRYSKLATTLKNLEANGIDFTDVMETFVSFSEKMDLVAIPLRRAKRYWGLGGHSLQKLFQESVTKEDPYRSFTRRRANKLEDPHFNVDFEELNQKAVSVVHDDGHFESVRELWTRYKDGDLDAGKTLKTYIEFVSHTNPRKSYGHIVNLTDVLQKQLALGNSEAHKNLFYAQMLHSAGPQTASAASSIAQVISEPIGHLFSPIMRGQLNKTGVREMLYGMGQFSGLMSGINQGRKAAMRMIFDGKLTNSPQRIEMNAKTFKDHQEQIRNLTRGALRELEADKSLGPSKRAFKRIAIAYNYHLQVASMHPAVQAGTRFLTAQDQMLMITKAHQEASARGFVKAFDDGKIEGFGSKETIANYVTHELDQIFEDGIRHGVITDGEVLDAAKGITMQRSIPTAAEVAQFRPEGTLAGKTAFSDSAFRALDRASKDDKLFRYFNPFVRVGYNFNDQIARGMYGHLSAVGMGDLFPRYQAILRGEMGPVAEMQLKSQVAYTRLAFMGNVGMALNGLSTGYNPPEGLPRESFIIPAPWTDKGYYAISHARIQPFSSGISLTADLVQAFQRGLMTPADYTRELTGIITSFSAVMLDQAFFNNFQKMTETFNLEMISKGLWSKTLADMYIAVPNPAALTREWFNVIQPYSTYNMDPHNPLMDHWRRVVGRYFGGIGNPVRINRYTGLPETKNAQGDLPYFAKVAANLASTLGYPGNINLVPDPNNPIIKEMHDIGFQTQARSFSQINGFELTPTDMANIDKLWYELGGNQQLNSYIKSKEYQTLKSAYLKARETPGGGEQSELLRKKLHHALLHQHNIVRQQAFNYLLDPPPGEATDYTYELQQRYYNDRNPENVLEQLTQ